MQVLHNCTGIKINANFQEMCPDYYKFTFNILLGITNVSINARVHTVVLIIYHDSLLLLNKIYDPIYTIHITILKQQRSTVRST